MIRTSPSLRQMLLGLAPLVLTPVLVRGALRAPFSSHDDKLFIVSDPRVAAGASWTSVWAPDEARFFYYPLSVWS